MHTEPALEKISRDLGYASTFNGYVDQMHFIFMHMLCVLYAEFSNFKGFETFVRFNLLKSNMDFIVVLEPRV
jgi:hypothetical protein